MLKKLSLACAALIAAASIAYAGGAFQGWPLVGGNGTSNCLSTGNNGVCNQFQPAGPPSTTGTETIPADTNVSGGGSNANPATVVIPIVTLGGGLLVTEAPLTGVSITLTAQTTKLAINPAGTIAAHTIVLPAATALLDGQTLEIGSTQIITALTVTAGSGTTVVGVPAGVLGAIGGFKIVYQASTATWFRIG
jgi:hypothetical protein